MRGDEHVFVLCHTKLITLANGDRVSLTSVMNITENKKFEQRLLVQSRMDALTKICNRGYGEAQIEKLLKAKKNGMFLLFDVDKFKHINDTYGHSIGDEVLIQVADALKQTFEQAGVCMRLGGDEFAVYAPEITEQMQAETMIQAFLNGFGILQSLRWKGMLSLSVWVQYFVRQIGSMYLKRYTSGQMLRCIPARK